MKSRLVMITSLLFFMPASSMAASSVEEMAQRARESLTKDGEYQTASIKAFWGDVSFMSECAPPLAAPFTIYFEVLPNGKLGEVVLDPDTMTAECVKRHVMNRKFPTPPGGPYVTKINMKFAP